MNRRDIEDLYPLSPMQQGMLFHTVHSPASGVYFEQSDWILRGDLDLSAFSRAWQAVVDRHTALRTGFLWQGVDAPLQVVMKNAELPVRIEDWGGSSPSEQESLLSAFLEADRRTGFDLTRPPLMRLALLKAGPGVCHCIWSHHHILLDGWSLPILFEEVIAMYEAFRSGTHPRLSPARPYRDYIAWIASQDPQAAETFWRSTFAGFVPPARGLNLGGSGHPADPGTYSVHRYLLPTELSAGLLEFTRTHRLTLNSLLQGAWGILLSKYLGSDDVVFGATVSGRPPELPGSESMVGLFINTLPVRIVVDPSLSVVSWLTRVQSGLAASRQYEHTPLVEIQRWASVPHHQKFFESLLVVENYPLSEAARERGATIRIETGRSFTRTNYPLTLAVSPGNPLGVEIAFERDHFGDGGIDRLFGHFCALLTGIIAAPSEAVGRLEMLPVRERDRLTAEYARGGSPGEFRPVQEMILEQSRRLPENPAVVSASGEFTYGELASRSEEIARQLRVKGVGRGAVVGVALDRSFELIAALLGTLRAGAAYLPVALPMPLERLQFMLADARVSLLVTRTEMLRHLPQTGVQVLCVDALPGDGDSGPAEDASVEGAVSPEDLAYVIYTSGSTGEPKGVEVTHGGVANHALWAAKSCALGPADRMLQFISLSFDAAAEEVFPSLVAGSVLILHNSPTTLSADQLVRFCDEQGVTLLHLPVAYWHQWVEELDRGSAGVPRALRMLIVGGESPQPDRIRQWHASVGEGVRLLNFYGPTETTITATTYEIGREDQTVPIGRPIDGVETYVLDRRLQPVPPGVGGELFIGGRGVARGYAGRPDLTAEKFLPHPYPRSPGERLYATGDIVRFREGGMLEFIGRADNQVKIRGFRVELEEVEAHLRSHPDVGAAVVVVRVDQTGERQLLAFVIGSNGRTPSAQGLQDELRKHLPEYMVPDRIGVLEAFPLTPHGKVDRRSLPALEHEAGRESVKQVPLRSVTEELLAGIWQDLLAVPGVTPGSDFFELGGHSLRAMQLVSRVRDVFNVELPLSDVFEASRLGLLSARIDAARGEAGWKIPPPLVPRDRSVLPPLSFAQQRLWFLDQLAPGGTFYNIPAAFELTGPLELEPFKASFRELLRRHEVLRTRFADRDGTPVQIVEDPSEVDIPLEDLSLVPPEERELALVRCAREEAEQTFSLSHGPLWRARVVRLDPERHVVFFTIHHIAADGWSMGILIRELGETYEALRAHQPVSLPPLSLQYADFAAWQRTWLQGEALEAHLSYWRERLQGAPPVLELPFDHPRPALQTFEGARHAVVCGRDLSSGLHELSRSEGVTTFMTLLAAFQVLLARYSGQTDILVGTPVAGRNRSELEQLIGFFVNTLVIRTGLDGNPTVRDLLRAVRQACLDGFAHQEVPFEKLVEEIAPVRDLSHSPVFQVMFVWQNVPPVALEMRGLTIRGHAVENRTSTFDLTLVMQEGPDGLYAEMEYKTALFESGTIERMLSHFVILLEEFVRNPDRPVLGIPFLSAEESALQLRTWNLTEAEFPSGQCVHQVFESLAARNPSAVALRYRRGPAEGEHRDVVTYGELNVRANRLARALTRLGVGADQIVGICTERSPEMVIAMLGVLKAGGAFLPLDPGYPRERLAFMIEDSGIQVLLTQAHLRDLLAPKVRHVLALDEEGTGATGEDGTDPAPEVSPENLAYVIYTSGSTGRPKGTMLPHRGLCNLARVQQKAFHIDGQSNVLQFSSLSFDASVWETVMALLNGAALTLTSQETIASAHDVAALIRQEEVTTVTLPPSVLAVFPPGPLPSLRTIITAGERCTLDLVRTWGGDREFFNAYGPTETTVCATMHRCSALAGEDPPIGRPISNFQSYILDAQWQPVPIGVSGELCIGGVGLARGYLRRPDLTADRFVPNPFAGERGERLYRTGDLCRYRADGSIEFLGRIDQQVKVRGFRVEPGEIETALRELDGVQDTVVLVREDVPGDRRLVAYLVMPEQVRCPVSELKSRLRERLPEFMIPWAFVFLDAMPLTPSKKIDRRALPPPDQSRRDLAQRYVAPRNREEEQLADIAARLLNVERVGVEDSFFELGGHSLLATQFVSRVREAFQVDLPLRVLFEKPTVGELALEIPRLQRAGTGAEGQKIKALSRDAARRRRSEVVSSENTA